MSEENISRRKYLKYAAAGAVVAGAAAVGGAYILTQPGPTATPTATPSASATATPTATPTLAPTPVPYKHGKSVMYLTPDIHETWWVACKEYLRQAVEADGWSFAFDVSDWSDSKCTDQLVLYSQQYDAIMVFPTSLEGINLGIKVAETENHCPVVVQKNFVIGEWGRFCISFDDHGTGLAQAGKAVDFVRNKYGTLAGKKVICFSGSRQASGWRMRAEGYLDGVAPYVEDEGLLSEEWDCTGNTSGWADQADLYFSTETTDAIVSGSGGPYFKGVFDALDRYGKLYYMGDANHIYCTDLDGKPTDLQWVRNAYLDEVFSQSPDCLMPIGWNLLKQYIINDSSYQYPPYNMRNIPTPLTVTAPPGGYWPAGASMTIDKGLIFPQVSMPQGVSPVYSVYKDNVNDERIWGNTYTFWKGKEDIQMVTWDAKGTRPSWSQPLLDAYEVMYAAKYQG